ncbi:phospholipase A2 group XV-like [Anopheles moucheti]|uniref:phospholipase A2 group XV-like n=1 Tax=Anopheles moucheti TaxID=186751 RepID=UPI0022F01865|nr:phospholipase A2 group XV-like [Anopheles moucheti]XP_052894494.1 phospholipase A2 group XV-like [Anopheles moucheti]XP_052894495.1 phospholipase A2 group XV-like [Anopheles moucheti]
MHTRLLLLFGVVLFTCCTLSTGVFFNHGGTHLGSLKHIFRKYAHLLESDRRLSPVIFVPGDGGSQMDAMIDKPSKVSILCQKHTTTFFNIWLNKELLLPLVIDCWIDNIRLEYDNVTRTSRNAPGVVTRVPGFGQSETVEWIDPSHASVGAYFVNIANALVANGYVRDKSILGAPYDFRKGPTEHKEYFLALKFLVEQTYTLNHDTPVTFIVHSMGAPMTLHFLQQQTADWKAKYIKRVISLAGAWAGSVKALKVYAIGDDLGAFALSGKVMRAEQITNPSLAWLLPSPLFWKPNEVLARTQSRTYTMSQMDEFFDDLDFPDGWEMRKDALPYALNFTAPGVELHCLYGSNINTVESLDYQKSYDLSGTPVLKMGKGDGTVNARSLEACQQWTKQQKQPIVSKEFPGADHMSILADVNVIDNIVKVLLADLSN